jgi:hypothetical protein
MLGLSKCSNIVRQCKSPYINLLSYKNVRPLERTKVIHLTKSLYHTVIDADKGKGLKYISVIFTDTQEDIMHKSLDNSRVITQKIFLSWFCTLGIWGVSLCERWAQGMPKAPMLDFSIEL